MRKKTNTIIAVVGLLLILLGIAVPPIAAQGIRVWFRDAFTSGIALMSTEECPCNCDGCLGAGGTPGYTLYIGHGEDDLECMANTHRVEDMTEMYRWESWDLDDRPEVGDIACIYWCCKPVCPSIWFEWKFQEVTVDRCE